MVKVAVGTALLILFAASINMTFATGDARWLVAAMGSAYLLIKGG